MRHKLDMSDLILIEASIFSYTYLKRLGSEHEKKWMFELGLKRTLNEITLGLDVHVFLEAFMVWLSKITSLLFY